MSRTTRTTLVRLFFQGLPTAAAALTTALLAPIGAWSAAGLAAFVGAGAWAGMLRRRSTLLPVPDQFIGS